MLSLLKLVVLCLSCLVSVNGQQQGVDMTLQRNAGGADVTSSVQSRIESSNLFNTPTSTAMERQNTELFVRDMAYVESQNGAEMGDGGIWRVSRRIFELTQRLSLNEIFDGICRIFCINWSAVGYDNLSRPLYSGLAVRIYLHHLHLTNQTSSLRGASTDTDRALFWALSFGESRDTSQWLMRIQQLRRIEGKWQPHEANSFSKCTLSSSLS